MNDNVNQNRTFKTKSIAELARDINSRAFNRYGFAKSDIVLHWKEIVGEILARSSLPERLVMPRDTEKEEGKAGVLHIRVEGSFAPEMQHLEPLVIDRINSYYGFKAVGRLVFHHGPIEQTQSLRKYVSPILSDSQMQQLNLLLKGIKDDKLRQSLFDVGAEIIGSVAPENVRQSKRFTRRGKGSLNKSGKKN
jgi:hypothetical protein